MFAFFLKLIELFDSMWCVCICICSFILKREYSVVNKTWAQILALPFICSMILYESFNYEP